MITRTEFEALSKGDKDLYLFDTLAERGADSKAEEVTPRAMPASWSNTTAVQTAWMPIRDDGMYWMPPRGWKDETGRLIAGMVLKEKVPADVVAAWEAGRVLSEGS